MNQPLVPLRSRGSLSDQLKYAKAGDIWHTDQWNLDLVKGGATTGGGKEIHRVADHCRLM